MEINNENILEEKTQKDESTDSRICMNINTQWLWDLHNDIISEKILV